MKRDKIIFWIATLLIVIFEGVLPALTAQSDEAKEGLKHLGYPEYFGVMLMFFKIIGALVLLLPKLPPTLKEFAYAGFGIDFIAAFVSIWAVDGLVPTAVFPLVAMTILLISYFYYHKIFIARESELAE